MTGKQLEVLNTIKDYIDREGIPPTVRELCDIVGLKSPSTMHGHIKRLESQGYISMIKGSPRSIKIVNN